MKLQEFFQKYPDETSCIKAIREYREKQGVICIRCSYTEHYFRQTDLLYQCKSCGSRQSLRRGTVMVKSKLPLSYWFYTMYLLSRSKKPISALQLQKDLGHKFYGPIWYMLHKLRSIMGKRENRYTIKEYIELDEGFFESTREKGEKKAEKEGLKRGRGSKRQSKVLVAIESIPVEAKDKYGVERKCGYVKMQVIEDLTSETINETVRSMVEKQSTIETDGYRGYSRLKNVILNHKITVAENSKQVSKIFPWVHTAIGNAKRCINGIHHSVSKKYLQNYLNEFCYKFNRRYFGDRLFDRLLTIAVLYTWF